MNKNEELGLGGMEYLAKAMVCAAIGVIVTMLMLLGFSALMTSGAGLEQLKVQYVIVSVIVGAIVAGSRCARKKKRGVVTAGFVASVCYILLLIIGALLMPNNDAEGSILLKNIIAAMCGGCFGGTLRLYRKNKKSKLRR